MYTNLRHSPPHYHKKCKCLPHTHILTTSLIPSHTQSTVTAHRDVADVRASLTAPTDDCSLLNQQRQRQGLFLWSLRGPTTSSSLHTYDLRQAYTRSDENCIKKNLHKAQRRESTARLPVSLDGFWCFHCVLPQYEL